MMDQVFDLFVNFFENIFSNQVFRNVFIFSFSFVVCGRIFRMIFHLLRSDPVDSFSEVFSYTCPLFEKGACPYSLKECNEEWCSKYCQMVSFEDEYEDEYGFEEE